MIALNTKQRFQQFRKWRKRKNKVMVKLNVSAKSNLYKLETKSDFCSTAENLKETLEQIGNQVKKLGSLLDEGQ